MFFFFFLFSFFCGVFSIQATSQDQSQILTVAELTEDELTEGEKSYIDGEALSSSVDGGGGSGGGHESTERAERLAHGLKFARDQLHRMVLSQPVLDLNGTDVFLYYYQDKDLAQVLADLYHLESADRDAPHLTEQDFSLVVPVVKAYLKKREKSISTKIPDEDKVHIGRHFDELRGLIRSKAMKLDATIARRKAVSRSSEKPTVPVEKAQENSEPRQQVTHRSSSSPPPVSKRKKTYGYLIGSLVSALGGIGLYKMISQREYSLRQEKGLLQEKLEQALMQRDRDILFVSYLELEIERLNEQIAAVSRLRLFTSIVAAGVTLGLGYGHLLQSRAAG